MSLIEAMLNSKEYSFKPLVLNLLSDISQIPTDLEDPSSMKYDNYIDRGLILEKHKVLKPLIL